MTASLGRGFQVVIKGRKEADSKTTRDTTWGWYIFDFRSRLKPKPWLILIMTRWHQDDPAGRIFPKDWNHESGWVKAIDGEMWYVINLPAAAEDNDILGRKRGDWLWEEWFTAKGWEQTRETAGKRNWNALYQQRPTEEEGSIIKRADWKIWPHDVAPECFFVLQSYDTAFEEGEEDDYTARTAWGLFMHPGPDNTCANPRLLLTIRKSTRRNRRDTDRSFVWPFCAKGFRRLKRSRRNAEARGRAPCPRRLSCRRACIREEGRVARERPPPNFNNGRDDPHPKTLVAILPARPRANFKSARSHGPTFAEERIFRASMAKFEFAFMAGATDPPRV